MKDRQPSRAESLMINAAAPPSKHPISVSPPGAGAETGTQSLPSGGPRTQVPGPRTRLRPARVGPVGPARRCDVRSRLCGLAPQGHKPELPWGSAARTPHRTACASRPGPSSEPPGHQRPGESETLQGDPRTACAMSCAGAGTGKGRASVKPWRPEQASVTATYWYRCISCDKCIVPAHDVDSRETGWSTLKVYHFRNFSVNLKLSKNTLSSFNIVHVFYYWLNTDLGRKWQN